MSRRNYPVAETYAERERDFYPRGRGARSTRDYDEIDIELRHSHGSVPDFLRDDYGRSSTAGPLVRRARTVVEDESDTRSRRGGGRSEVDRKEEIIIKERDSDRRSERSRLDIDETASRRSERRPARPREIERDDIIFRRGEGEHRPRPREVERDLEIDIRKYEREDSPGAKTVEKEEIVIKEDDLRSRRGPRSVRERSRSVSREKVIIRSRSKSRSRPPPRELVARETEEFVIRRRKPPSPSSSSSSSPSPPPAPRRREHIEEEIIIRRMGRSPSPLPPPPEPEPEPVFEPEPEPEPIKLPPIVRPPIHQEIIQEIITHHRHIDHGVERYRSPSPEPLPLPPPREPTPPPAPPRIETLEIDIRRRENGRVEEKDIRIERREKTRSRATETDVVIARPRARSLSSAAPHHHHDDRDDNIAEEADYYNRRAMSRGYAGEAYNGATRDWGLVDIPPGTERVRMDGAGGGAQELSWKRYDGNRRSKFITGDREYDTGFGGSEKRNGRSRVGEDMWTEVTKDLVIRDAVDAMGYQYEETESFFYVMEYLKYEDVLQLVELSDDIRSDRRRRIREIESERRGHRGGTSERGFEREFIFERERRR